MATYTQPQIQEMLQLHKKWLADEEGGVRANLRFANLSGAENFQPFISVGPLGSRKGYTYIHLNEDVIRCGCFTGTLAEFREAVLSTHADSAQHRTSYMALRAGRES